MLKSVSPPPGWLAAVVAHVDDICSLSNCVSTDFADAFKTSRHNGWWLYDAPAIISEIVEEQAIDTCGMSLFYYEVYEQERGDDGWATTEPDTFPTAVLEPSTKALMGFDVTTHYSQQGPECSPLSCNHMAKALRTNRH